MVIRDINNGSRMIDQASVASADLVLGNDGGDGAIVYFGGDDLMGRYVLVLFT
jgi:hypothetical protein